MASYKCWSPDLGIPEEEGTVITHDWFDAEDVAHEYVDTRYHDWESPEGPFEILVAECDSAGTLIGEVRTFKTEVEYQPSFYTSEVTKKEPTV